MNAPVKSSRRWIWFMLAVVAGIALAWAWRHDAARGRRD